MIQHIPFNAVQSALYQLLSKGQTVPVYDKIPTGEESYPYIWLGEFHDANIDDNKTGTMHNVSQQLDIWSNAGGKKEINSILDDVTTLVTKYQLSLKEYKQIGTAHIALCQALGERYEDKTSAYHGILIIEYTLEQLGG